MDLPKMKILIYALTFAGYAWSGYGSNILSNLKDAILAAEAVFGDVFVKVLDVAKKLKYVHDTLDSSVDEECKWSCPNGAKAVQNKLFKPTPNGCGPVDVELDVHIPFPDMTKCCNEHDVCYSTCNKDKDDCDLRFKKCLYKICEAIPEEDILSRKGCKASAKILYSGTTTLGCKFYKDSQEEACYCDSKKKKDSKRMYGEL